MKRARSVSSNPVRSFRRSAADRHAAPPYDFSLIAGHRNCYMRRVLPSTAQRNSPVAGARSSDQQEWQPVPVSRRYVHVTMGSVCPAACWAIGAWCDLANRSRLHADTCSGRGWWMTSSNNLKLVPRVRCDRVALEIILVKSTAASTKTWNSSALSCFNIL